MIKLKRELCIVFAIFLAACGGGDDNGGGTINPYENAASVYTTDHSVFLPPSVDVNGSVSGDFDGALVSAGSAAVETEAAAVSALSDRDVTGFVAQVPAQEDETTATAVAERIDVELRNGYDAFNPSQVTMVSRQSQDDGNAIMTIYRLQLYSSLTPTDLGNALVQLLGLNIEGGSINSLPESSEDETTYSTYQLYLTTVYHSETDVYISAAVAAKDLKDIYQPVLTGITSYTNVGDLDVELGSDTVTQVAEGGGGEADFLFVIDNSGSMNDEQEAISQAATDFEEAMENSGLDYRMGVVTTDSQDLQDTYSDGAFTSDMTEFQDDVVVGIYGSAYESGIWFGEQALESDGSVIAEGYPREDASLSVIIMSDEVDQYTTYSGGVAFDTNDNLFIDNGYRVYSIVDTDSSSYWYYGETYMELANATGGSYASIDELDAFAEIMTEIANNAGGASSIYELGYYPITGTIVVTVDGAAISNDYSDGWTYNIASNSIVFHGDSIPEGGKNVVIVYDYLQAS